MVPVSPSVSESNTNQRSILAQFFNSPHAHLLLWSQSPFPGFQDGRGLLHSCTLPLELSNQTHQRQHKDSYHSWKHVLWCHNNLDLRPPKSNQFISKRTLVPDLIKSPSGRSGDIVFTRMGRTDNPGNIMPVATVTGGRCWNKSQQFQRQTQVDI